jgi:outer membrane protein assembly factor BamE (lipoprotein component of BamABCDE complex)
MNAGRMDPAGRKQTQTARMLAMISTIFWPLVLCPCCGVAVFYQMSTGDNLIAGLGSRRITEKEFKRVNEGMTKKQVTDLIGQPAKTETRGGRANWYWYEKDGRATFTLDFDDRGRVRDRGVDTPD